jgi:hypothetical protein
LEDVPEKSLTKTSRKVYPRLHVLIIFIYAACGKLSEEKFIIDVRFSFYN